MNDYELINSIFEDFKIDMKVSDEFLNALLQGGLFHDSSLGDKFISAEELSKYFQIDIFYYNPNIESVEFEKRLNEQIRFTSEVYGDTVKVSVTYIKVFSSFFELFSELGCEGEYRRFSPLQLAESMREYYTEEDETKYGTVALGIRLIGPELRIIARVKNDFPTKFGLPRQGGLVDEIKGTVKFLPEYRVKEALKGLDIVHRRSVTHIHSRHVQFAFFLIYTQKL